MTCRAVHLYRTPAVHLYRAMHLAYLGNESDSSIVSVFGLEQPGMIIGRHAVVPLVPATYDVQWLHKDGNRFLFHRVCAWSGERHVTVVHVHK